MSTDEVTPPATKAERGACIMVSYRELVEIRTKMEAMNGMLQAALALSGRVTDMDKRINVLEVSLAGRVGARGVWNTILAFVAGVVATALGGGAISFLPLILGWHH